MISYVGLDCPGCNRPFIEEDDVVVCPVCGAPHHRECWNQLGHCACEQAHGTDHEWKRPQQQESQGEEKQCPRCGAMNPEEGLFCLQCGLPLNQEEAQAAGRAAANAPFGGVQQGRTVIFVDPMGGVDPSETIDEIPVTEIASFLGSNSAYYLPRFVSMHKNKSSVSLNWSAGILEGFWMLYRRMIKPFLLFTVVTLLLNIPYFITLFQYMSAAFQDVSYFLSNRDVNPLLYHPSEGMLLVSNILSYVTLLIRVGLLLFGNRIYMAYVMKKVRQIREDEPDTAKRGQVLCIKGGVKPAYPLIYIAVYSGIFLVIQMLATLLLT